jgi:hypothetical protein
MRGDLSSITVVSRDIPESGRRGAAARNVVWPWLWCSNILHGKPNHALEGGNYQAGMIGWNSIFPRITSVRIESHGLGIVIIYSISI